MFTRGVENLSFIRAKYSERVGSVVAAPKLRLPTSNALVNPESEHRVWRVVLTPVFVGMECPIRPWMASIPLIGFCFAPGPGSTEKHWDDWPFCKPVSRRDCIAQQAAELLEDPASYRVRNGWSSWRNRCPGKSLFLPRDLAALAHEYFERESCKARTRRVCASEVVPGSHCDLGSTVVVRERRRGM